LPVFGVAKFERFFRAAAELDVDKSAEAKAADGGSAQAFRNGMRNGR
jgi:hypothetical protein